MTVLANIVDAELTITVEDSDTGNIVVRINRTKINATTTTIDQWDAMSADRKEALINYYVSIYRSY